MIKLDTINYLDEIRGKQPNSRFAIGFDGERLGVIGYSLVGVTVGGDRLDGAYVWFADRYENVGMNQAFELLGELTRIGIGVEVQEVPIYAKGQKASKWTFTEEAKKEYGIKVTEFEKKSYGRWSVEEIVISVKDDMSQGLIAPAPEFRGRPEYETLNATLRNLKLTKDLDVLAEAAIYGLGYFSALERRKKWKIGNGPRLW